jgi:hypothetical protein
MTSFISYVTCDSCAVQEAIPAQYVIGVEIAKWLRKKCTRQFALNAGRNVKFPSSLTRTDLFTAVSAGLRNAAQDEDSRLD